MSLRCEFDVIQCDERPAPVTGERQLVAVVRADGLHRLRVTVAADGAQRTRNHTDRAKCSARVEDWTSRGWVEVLDLFPFGVEGTSFDALACEALEQALKVVLT